MPNKMGVFYFSGTGNTEIVAELYRNELMAAGFAVELVPVEKFLKEPKTEDVWKYDLIGLGYAVHAFNAPRIIYDFIRQLPKAQKQQVFLFKTAGDPYWDGGSTTMLRSRLKRKGYLVFHESLFVMPANLAIRYDDRLSKQLYETAVMRVKRFTAEIINGTTRYQNNPLYRRIGSRVFSEGESLGMRLLGPFFQVGSSCVHCGKCVKACPTGNIREKNGRIRFGWNCLFCLRCIYLCPKQAIRPGVAPFVIFKEGYDIRRLIASPHLQGDYVNKDSTGFFRRFYDYIRS